MWLFYTLNCNPILCYFFNFRLALRFLWYVPIPLFFEHFLAFWDYQIPHAILLSFMVISCLCAQAGTSRIILNIISNSELLFLISEEDFKTFCYSLWNSFHYIKKFSSISSLLTIFLKKSWLDGSDFKNYINFLLTCRIMLIGFIY